MKYITVRKLCNTVSWSILQEGNYGTQFHEVYVQEGNFVTLFQEVYYRKETM